MNVEEVICNNCGASLDVTEDTNYVSCRHCGSRLVVRQTENVRFTEVLSELKEQVDKLTQQNEVEALDRQWESEKESYMVTGKHGHRSLPTRTGSVIGGVVIAAFGIFWTIVSSGIAGGFGGPFTLFPLFGVIFVIGGIAMSVHSYSKAVAYENAQRRHQRRRRELRRRINK